MQISSCSFLYWSVHPQQPLFPIKRTSSIRLWPFYELFTWLQHYSLFARFPAGYFMRRLATICQIPKKCREEIHLRKPTHPASSYSPLRRQSFSQLVPAKKDVPVIFFSSFLLPLIRFSLPGPSINVKMRQNVAILYLHPHSLLIPSLYPQPFPQLHLFNSPHHFSPWLGLSSRLAPHQLPLSS